MSSAVRKWQNKANTCVSVSEIATNHRKEARLEPAHCCNHHSIKDEGDSPKQSGTDGIQRQNARGRKGTNYLPRKEGPKIGTCRRCSCRPNWCVNMLDRCAQPRVLLHRGKAGLESRLGQDYPFRDDPSSAESGCTFASCDKIDEQGSDLSGISGK
jgi:hypothetical protein